MVGDVDCRKISTEALRGTAHAQLFRLHKPCADWSRTVATCRRRSGIALAIPYDSGISYGPRFERGVQC